MRIYATSFWIQFQGTSRNLMEQRHTEWVLDALGAGNIIEQTNLVLCFFYRNKNMSIITNLDTPMSMELKNKAFIHCSHKPKAMAAAHHPMTAWPPHHRRCPVSFSSRPDLQLSPLLASIPSIAGPLLPCLSSSLVFLFILVLIHGFCSLLQEHHTRGDKVKLLLRKFINNNM